MGYGHPVCSTPPLASGLTWILSLNFLMPEKALSVFRAWILTLLSLSSSMEPTKLMSSAVQEEAWGGPGEAEEAGEVGVLGPPPPMSPRPLSKSPPALRQRHRSQDRVWPAKGGRDRCGPQGRLAGRGPRRPPLTSASSKYTQRVMLCRVMLLAYSSCLDPRELRSLRSSPESRPCRSRSTARPRQPPQPGSGCGLGWDQRTGLGGGGEGPGDKAALPFLRRPACSCRTTGCS